MTPAEELTKAADKLDAIIAGASPGPWYYNSYSFIGSVPKSQAYHEWHPEDEGHTLERDGDCEPCGKWREPIACLPNWKWPRGHGCRHFEQDYDMDPEVAKVPSHHGDTAVRSRKADAEYIEATNPLVGAQLAALMRVSAEALETVSADEQTSVACDIDGYVPHPLLAIARLINGGGS